MRALWIAAAILAGLFVTPSQAFEPRQFIGTWVSSDGKYTLKVRRVNHNNMAEVYFLCPVCDVKKGRLYWKIDTPDGNPDNYRMHASNNNIVFVMRSVDTAVVSAPNFPWGPMTLTRRK
jgi:hypothetical protein